MYEKGVVEQLCTRQDIIDINKQNKTLRVKSGIDAIIKKAKIYGQNPVNKIVPRHVIAHMENEIIW